MKRQAVRSLVVALIVLGAPALMSVPAVAACDCPKGQGPAALTCRVNCGRTTRTSHQQQGKRGSKKGGPHKGKGK
jgi:hypothetical protein